MTESTQPPIYESPDEIRRQRDVYREILRQKIKEEWKDVKIEDWNSPDGGRAELDAIIMEVEESLRNG